MTLRPRTRRYVLSAAAVLIGLLMVGSYLGSAGVPLSGVGAPGAAVAVGHSSTPSRATGTSQPRAPTFQPPALPSSGRGSFWLNSLLGQPSNATQSCTYTSYISYFGPSCTNDTGSPAIAVNNAGVMVTATTAFTNATACTGYGNITETEVGITVSSNGGASWGLPTYVADPGCANAANYSSAMWPALTTLANGTFVLAYLQYNMTPSAFCDGYAFNYYFPSLFPCFLTWDQLVVSESFNNGVSWTFPTTVVAVNNSLLNYSAPVPAQPALASFGNTVYLAWTNFSSPEFQTYFGIPNPSIGLNLAVSTNGGLSFGNSTALPTVEGNWTSGNTNVSYAPSLVVNSTGALFVAYSTNLTFQPNYVCQPTGCGYLYNGPEATMDVVVAASTDNGTSFNLTTVGSGVPVVWNGGYSQIYYSGSLVAPEPSIAVNPATNELYVAYTGGAFGTFCYTYGCYPSYGDDFQNLWFSNSTNGSRNWSAPAAIGDTTLGIYGAAASEEMLFTPSVAVGANGTVWVNAALQNDSACVALYYCGILTDYVFESTDNGSTFPSVFNVGVALGTVYEEPMWDGIDTSIAVYNGEPFVAWTWENCPGVLNGTYCYSPPGSFNGDGYSQVVVSTPFAGTGLTVTFNETGLPSGTNWSISLEGNARGGASGTNLSVSGVPPLYNLNWSVAPVASTSYGVEYESTISPAPPGNFTANTVISVDFHQYALVTVSTVPPGQPGFAFACPPGATFADYCSNQNVTPVPGASYIEIGTPFAYGISNATIPLYCYSCYNLTFQSWTGTGAGSWNTTVPNGTTTILGPVNETVSFALNQVCSYGCFNLTYDYNFTEVGLPTNTTWAVTLGNQTNTTTSEYANFQAGFGPLSYTIWTVSYNASYYYVGTPDIPSPLIATQGLVIVTYRLVPIADQNFAVNFTESGVPASASGWGLELGSTLLGLPLSVTGSTLTLPGGSPGTTLNATTVYGNAGVGARISSFEVTPDTVGGSSYSVAPGGSLQLEGPASVVAEFSPIYWLDIPASANGTVNQSSQWVDAGATVALNATPDAGYSFVGWSGTGTGARTSADPSIRVTPGGPVTEVAVFAPLPDVFDLNITATGLPAGADLTFVLGGTTYTGTSPIQITGIAAGMYSVSAPTVVVNNTVGVQYPSTGITSTLELSVGVLTVNADGSVTVAYAAQYLLTIEPTVNGTLTPSPGTYWETGGSSVTVTASPSAGFTLVGWTGAGEGSYNGTALSEVLTMNGPIAESATFALYVAPPPATYTLTLTPTGLPSGTVWSASIGSEAQEGTGPLVFTGLNGTYSVAIATLSPADGVEYLPASNTVSIGVTADTPYTVAFATMYEITVTATSGGVVTPATAWVAAGSTVSLDAIPSSGYSFVNWNGSGPNSYTGTTASATFTATGPVTEFATFETVAAPPPTTTSGGSSSGSLLVPILALVALLVAGLVIGLLLARSGGRRPPPAEAAPAAAPAPVAGSGPTEAGSEAPPPADSGEETVYGGGSA